jgi:streptomycin 3"-adenylyltransferase
MIRLVEDPVPAQTDAALRAIDATGVAPLGVYLYGSAVDGGLRPDSDLDLFAVVPGPLPAPQRDALVAALLPISERSRRPAAWRPLEVTVVTADAVRPWNYPPRLELQYGEWMRAQFAAGERTPWPSVSPDLAIIVTMVRQSGRPLIGPPAVELLDPVPAHDLVRAMTDELPSLLAELEDDTRNVLLTLARIWLTATTGQIRPKDVAARWAAERMPPHLRPVIERAGELYVVGGFGPWPDDGAVRDTAAHIAAQIASRRGAQPQLGG